MYVCHLDADYLTITCPRANTGTRSHSITTNRPACPVLQREACKPGRNHPAAARTHPRWQMLRQNYHTRRPLPSPPPPQLFALPHSVMGRTRNMGVTQMARCEHFTNTQSETATTARRGDSTAVEGDAACPS